MFSQACVKNFCPGGVCQTPPLPRQTSRHPPGRHPLGRHLPGQTPPWADTPRADTTTAADGTHPTGMHSCSKISLDKNPPKRQTHVVCPPASVSRNSPNQNQNNFVVLLVVEENPQEARCRSQVVTVVAVRGKRVTTAPPKLLPEGGANPKGGVANLLLYPFCPKNCMKSKRNWTWSARP